MQWGSRINTTASMHHGICGPAACVGACMGTWPLPASCVLPGHSSAPCPAPERVRCLPIPPWRARHACKRRCPALRSSSSEGWRPLTAAGPGSCPLTGHALQQVCVWARFQNTPLKTCGALCHGCQSDANYVLLVWMQVPSLTLRRTVPLVLLIHSLVPGLVWRCRAVCIVALVATNRVTTPPPPAHKQATWSSMTTKGEDNVWQQMQVTVCLLGNAAAVKSSPWPPSHNALEKHKSLNRHAVTRPNHAQLFHINTSHAHAHG